MEKKIGEHTIVFVEKMTFRDFMAFSDLAQKQAEGVIGETEMMFQSLPYLVDSWDDLKGEEATQAIENIDDHALFVDLIEAYGEAVKKITNEITKKKK